MRLIDAIDLGGGAEPRRIELLQGDVSALEPDEHVNVLIVSAFPNYYLPWSGTVIGALDRAGLSVAKLAERKAEDLRENFASWLSQPIEAQLPGLEFDRILCFEPLHKGRAPEVVGDVFRSLAPFVFGNYGIRAVASPLLASGDQGEDPVVMLREIVTAAWNWMSEGFPLKVFRLVLNEQSDAEPLAEKFARLKASWRPTAEEPQEEPQEDPPFDLFVSYAHADAQDVLPAVEELRRHSPGASIFLDEQVLNPGVAWLQELYSAIESCRHVAAFYSPAYLKSKMCQQEYNITHLREVRGEDVLFPIFLLDSKLPLYYQLKQYVDCREADQNKLSVAMEKLRSRLEA